MGRKKWVRKAEPSSERGIAWPRWTGFRGKTVWDWMDLLIVPLALVVIGLLFSMLQDARQQALENQRQEQALAIENKRAEAERELAEQRAQDEALQSYLDQMSQLMLERKLLEAEPGDPVYTLAQARTSTAILRLDAEHKASVIRFLSDAGLTTSGEVSINILSGIALNGADLRNVSLSDLDLSNAFLPRADLSDAELNSADLSNAFLLDANLRDAILFNADLSGACLSGAYLSGADLSGADLIGADLSGAVGFTNEELEQQAKTLKGATMPNGQKYEDWLKDKENRGEDEKNE